ncbi:HNH endonuclease signature motif containing protein [Pengzhenrongella sicca]|uniref:DUF222 domain-containing protein n=1 Tax=Pengzhenrongella sicca TaxID=2819238 RepID=A0A8A4Z9N7_9MICO|nr:HNH endonuclease signature motif containing protein [Pengzhenrongella sicca]QTE28185.1 DUF222 domain-containing protein [Pengzhenrongella sicca]
MNSFESLAATAGREVSVADRLVRLRAEVDALVAIDPRELGASAVEFFDQVFEASDRLHAAAASVLPTIDDDGMWACAGARSFASWVAARARVTRAYAHRLTRLGRALTGDLTPTAAAIRAGGPERLGVDHAQILISAAATSDLRRTLLADPDHDGQRFLLTQARTLPADQFRLVAHRWAAVVDPDADERGYRTATDREYLDVAATTGGYHLAGYLTTDHGQALLVALDAVTSKPAPGDTRTGPQRRAGALTDLARTCLDRGLLRRGAIIRPHLSVLIDYPTLHHLTTHTDAGDKTGQTGTCTCPADGLGPVTPAVFEDGQVVPRAVLDSLLCDAAISRYIFGPDSQLINIGRTERIYPDELRRAIIARDTHCQYPGCTAPPRLCEAHHTKHWGRDHGTTDATTGVLLCWHHHIHVHTHDIDITWKTHPTETSTEKHGKRSRKNAPTGHWEFTDRNGNLIQ